MRWRRGEPACAQPSPAAQLTPLPVPWLPDGCWFWPLLPPYSRGTGVFVNTGNTLVLDTFDQAKALKPKGAPCIGDCLEASGAAARGYDSVQMLHGKYMYHPELLVTRAPCLRAQNHSGPTPCPPPGIELRTGTRATLPCQCSSASLRERVGAGTSFINCDGDATA